MSAHEPDDLAAGIPLKALVEDLRGRCEAVARLQGGSTYFIEELGIFRDCARHYGYLLASHAEPPRAAAGRWLWSLVANRLIRKTFALPLTRSHGM